MTADNQVDGEYDTQGWNRYSYVKNNPIMYKDPTGHEGFEGLLSDIKNGIEVLSNGARGNGFKTDAQVRYEGLDKFYGADLKQAKGQERVLSPKAQRLARTIETEISRNDVQPGFPNEETPPNYNTTWCNRAAFRIAQNRNRDIDSLLELHPRIKEPTPSIGYTNANQVHKNAIRASKNRESGIVAVSPERAQELANQGRTVLATQDGRLDLRSLERGPAHMGIVYPDTQDFDKARGPKIGQAGAHNGVFYQRQGAFLNDESLPVNYYLLNKAKN